QRDQTVNLTALPSKVRILLPPPSFRKPGLVPGFRISDLPNPLFLCTAGLIAVCRLPIAQ
ncbi:hypothetical protein, partial [Aeromonas allosaccharophila]|uniref:hypothetical protein n=1 Tax=Aeromonas allosaccharophila TaxID=656 RepID=UPI003D1A7115